MIPMIARTETRGKRSMAAFGKSGHGKPDESVGSHLQQDACQDHASSGRRLGMGIGQPGMEGKHGNLDGKGQGKGPEEPVLCSDG